MSSLLDGIGKYVYRSGIDSPYPCIPYTVRILKSVFELVGEKMEMQARRLGAGKIQTFVHLNSAYDLTGITSAGSMAFIVSYSQYFLTFLIGGGKIITFSMLMFPFVQSGEQDGWICIQRRVHPDYFHILNDH